MLNENVLPGTKKYILTLLIIILLIGSILRIYGLDKQSLWNDELESWRQASCNKLTEVILNNQWDIHPPGYRIFLYYVEKYLGDSEKTLRFPSVISGAVSILVIFMLGLRYYSFREGLIASSLMSACLCPIFYSQEARAYSMLLLFSMLSFYFWFLIIDVLRKRIKVQKYAVIGYITCSIVSSYLHYYGLFLVILQGAYALLIFIRRSKVLIKIVLIYMPILFAYLPWLPFMLKHLSAGGTWIPAPNQNIFSEFIDCISYLFDQNITIAKIVILLYLYLLANVLYNCIRKKRCKSNIFSPGFILVLWLVVPFIIAYVKSILSTPVLTYRNLIISLPPAYLLASHSIVRLFYWLKNQFVIVVCILSLLVFHLVYNANFYSSVYKEEFRGAVNFIVEHNKIYENSLIIGNCDYFDYYFKRINYPKVLNIILSREGDIQNAMDIINREKADYIWYVWAFISQMFILSIV